MKKGSLLLGATALLAISGGLYFFVIRPNQSATEKQFEEFRSATQIAGWDIFDLTSSEQLNLALSQWKKNLKRKEAEQMIMFAKNKKETLQLMKLIKQWNPRAKK